MVFPKTVLPNNSEYYKCSLIDKMFCDPNIYEKQSQMSKGRDWLNSLFLAHLSHLLFMVSDPTVKARWRGNKKKKKKMNKHSLHPLNEADKKSFSCGTLFWVLPETLHLTGLLSPPGYDLSLALYHLHRLLGHIAAFLLQTITGVEGTCIFLYSEKNKWIASLQASVSPQSSNWQASFSQNFVPLVTKAKTSRSCIPGDHTRVSECPSLGLM